MNYTSVEAQWLRRKREAETGESLLLCSDGLFRTLAEKNYFDAVESQNYYWPDRRCLQDEYEMYGGVNACHPSHKKVQPA